MDDRPILHLKPLETLSREEKRTYLDVLSNTVWDIEAQLALVKAERAALMSSIQADIRTLHR